MDEKMIACCGLTCNDCGAYIAKRTNDEKLREETAAKWSSPEWTVTPAEINCDGCKSSGGVLFKHCLSCTVRACVNERELDNCGQCSDYSCEKIEAIMKATDPSIRQTLDKIHAAL